MLDWLISSHHPKPNPVSCKLPAQHPLTCFELESVVHVYNAIGCFLTLASVMLFGPNMVLCFRKLTKASSSFTYFLYKSMFIHT